MYIFTQVSLEPFGRIGIGVLELIANILILVPKTTWLGATLVLGIIGGAIMMHLTDLGIDINGDGGLLFYTAIVTFILSLVTLWLSRRDIPIIDKKWFTKANA
ncbi:DoxX family protein [Winogradskyella sp.]|uniref:DoxX family protein n=1 Tax=Winogradskyella sp. TaxID=1883156 RepID=UPI0025E1BA4C|nr:DoxX family protein [Winogradskyella sp.]